MLRLSLIEANYTIKTIRSNIESTLAHYGEVYVYRVMAQGIHLESGKIVVVK